MAKIALIPELAYGVLSTREDDGSIGSDIPSWIIDDVDRKRESASEAFWRPSRTRTAR